MRDAYYEVTPPLELLIRGMLIQFGEDPDRQGLLDTPKRVAKAWREMLPTYGKTEADEQGLYASVFESGIDELVVERDIGVFSFCEHHLLPFYGVCHIGYLPGGKVLGLSKFVRIVRHFSGKLQIQERLTREICDSIHKHLQCRAVLVIVKAQHLCMIGRGVKEHNPTTITSAIAGEAYQNVGMKNEFYSMIGGL